MYLTEQEKVTLDQALELVMSRKRPDIPSVLQQFDEFSHQQKDIDKYFKAQVVNAIARPLAKMFFLSHNSFTLGVEHELAEFIEDNSYSFY